MASKPAFVARIVLRPWVPYAVLVTGVALALAAANYVASTERAGAQAEFHTVAREAGQQIQFRIDTYLEVIRAGGALLRVNNEIQASEFRAFVAGLQLQERFPGLEGIGFAPWVPRRQLGQLLRNLRLEGSNIRLSPGGRRPEYFPTIFFEPPLKGQPPVGFDLGTHPALLKAMESARDSGGLTITTMLAANSFGGINRDPTALVLLPTYKTGAVLDTTEDRRRALVGFVLAPLRLKELLRHMSEEISANVVFDIYDGSTAVTPDLQADADRGPYHHTQSVQIADRHWIVLVSSRVGADEAVITKAAQRTLFLGFSFSVLLFLISRIQIRAWRVAATHEAELQASELTLQKTESDLRMMVDLERHARSEAQTASRAKDEFLTVISHELRTPLNAVIGWVSMLRSGAVREERRPHALETIERNARLQVQLIEDLLDVSRLAMGKTRLELRLANLDPIVNAVMDSLRPAAETRGLTLMTSTRSGGNLIRADTGRVQQIVWNLVSNAIKFTPPGGRVDVHVERDDAHVRVVVRDTGIGIRPEFLPHVFERFRQGDSSTTRAYGGVGLGLAIVRELVDMHGGSVAASSEGENRGTTFTVQFPSAAVVGQSMAPLTQGPPVVPALRGVRVLVVDDDLTTRELLSEALAAMQANTVVAGSVPEALERLLSEGADIVVSDIAMPLEDGFSLIHRIRSLTGPLGQIPAIALTAYARAEDHDKAVQAGFQISLTKPVALIELQDSISQLVRHAA